MTHLPPHPRKNNPEEATEKNINLPGPPTFFVKICFDPPLAPLENKNQVGLDPPTPDLILNKYLFIYGWTDGRTDNPTTAGEQRHKQDFHMVTKFYH